MVTIKQIGQCAPDEAGLRLGLDLTVDGLLDLDANTRLFREAFAHLNRHDALTAFRRHLNPQYDQSQQPVPPSR